MSESSFPFKGQAVADAPASDVTEAESNKAVLVIAAGLAAVVVLAVVAYLLFFSGGDDSDATAKAPKAPAAGAVVPAPEAVAPVTRQRISAKSFGRDPFEAQIVAVDTTAVAPGVPSTVGSDGTTTTDTGTSGTTPDTTTADIATPDTTTTVPSDTVPSPSARHLFQVVSASADNTRVTVKVDGKTYKNLRAGEVFATIFKVRVVGGEVNQFQVGDERFRVQGLERITVAG